MKFLTQSFTLFLMLTFACFCKPIYADLVIGFSGDGGGSFADDFDIKTGDSLSVGIYLRQTTSDTVLTDDGIVSWGLSLARSPENLGNIANLTVNPVFDFEQTNNTTATGFEWEFAESAGLGIKGDAILLGSFDFDSIAVGTTTFAVQDLLQGSGAGNASWVTSEFEFLDEQIFGNDAVETHQFSVNATSAVPEPNSLLVLSLVAVLQQDEGDVEPNGQNAGL